MTVAIGFAVLAVLAEPLPTVSSDAPDQTNGTFTVAPGAWQVELGLDAALPGSDLSGGELPLRIPTTLRIGLSPRVELRAFDGERLFHRDVQGEASGETSFGFKIRFDDPRPDAPYRPLFGLQPYVAFPTVELLDHTESLALGATLLWAQPVARWLAVDINLGAEIAYDRDAPPVSSFASMSAQASASARWLPYAEIYADIPWRKRSALELGTDAGFVVVANRRLAFNLAGRATIVAPARSYGVLAGLAVLLADGTRWRRFVASR